MKTLTIEVRTDERGRTLQTLLHDRGGFSHAEARGLIDAGAVRGPTAIAPGQYARRVRPGERYIICHEEGRRYRPRAAARPGRGYRIVHQDRHLLVIDKEPDLLSVPTSLRREESLVERLLEAERRRGVRRPALYAVHRLDRDYRSAQRVQLSARTDSRHLGPALGRSRQPGWRPSRVSPVA